MSGQRLDDQNVDNAECITVFLLVMKSYYKCHVVGEMSTMLFCGFNVFFSCLKENLICTNVSLETSKEFVFIVTCAGSVSVSVLYSVQLIMALQFCYFHFEFCVLRKAGG